MQNLNIPHSLVLWIQLQIHERKTNGQLSGVAVERKKYEGHVHCDSKEEAVEKLQTIILDLQEVLKTWQTQTQT